MRVESTAIEIETSFERGMVDITPQIGKVIREREIEHGVLTLVSSSSSCGILILENEPDLIRGVGGLLGAVGSTATEIRKLETEASRPAFAAALTGVTCSIPVAGGQLLIGHDRRIFLMECAGPGFRKVLVHMLTTSAIDHTVLETEGGRDIRAEESFK